MGNMSTNPNGLSKQHAVDRSKRSSNTSQYSQGRKQRWSKTAKRQQKALTIPKMTSEDQLFFKKCKFESLFKYEIPFMFAGCAAIYTLGRKRLIVPRLWKYTAALYLGIVAGTMSYVGKIEDKLVKSKLDTPYASIVRVEYIIEKIASLMVSEAKRNQKQPATARARQQAIIRTALDKLRLKECQKEYLFKQGLISVAGAWVVLTVYHYEQRRSGFNAAHLGLCLIQIPILYFLWQRLGEKKLSDYNIKTIHQLMNERKALPDTHEAAIGPTTSGDGT